MGKECGLNELSCSRRLEWIHDKDLDPFAVAIFGCFKSFQDGRRRSNGFDVVVSHSGVDHPLTKGLCSFRILDKHKDLISFTMLLDQGQEAADFAIVLLPSQSLAQSKIGGQDDVARQPPSLAPFDYTSGVSTSAGHTVFAHDVSALAAHSHSEDSRLSALAVSLNQREKCSRRLICRKCFLELVCISAVTKSSKASDHVE